MSTVRFSSTIIPGYLRREQSEVDRKIAIEYARGQEQIKTKTNDLNSKTGQKVTSVHYTYTMGPDGKRYITGAIVKTSLKTDIPSFILQNPSKDNNVNEPDTLSPREKQQVRELEEVDREVRKHENAHHSAGGAYAAPPTFGYTTGPDGKRYAVSGQVRISTPTTDDPQKAAELSKRIFSAAMAPVNGLSAQDISVAAQAAHKAARNAGRTKHAVDLYNKHNNPKHLQFNINTVPDILPDSWLSDNNAGLSHTKGLLYEVTL